MREIKFRVWNKIEEKMVYYDKDCSSPDMTLNDVLLAHRDQSNVSYIYELMQFTGLKDKNDKEDYDGNIWEVEYRGKKHRFSHKSELDWEGYIFSFKCLTGEVSPVHANVGEDGIIIGNIHQNPELREQE